MTDTVKDLTDLKADLADNTSENISPQDVRHFLVSCFVHGMISKNTIGDQQDGIGAIAVLLEGWGTEGPVSPDGGVTLDQENNKIVLDVEGRYLVTFQGSFECNATARYTFRFRVGGTLDENTNLIADLTAGEISTQTMSAIVDASNNDDLEVYVSSNIGDGKLTPYAMQLTVVKVG